MGKNCNVQWPISVRWSSLLTVRECLHTLCCWDSGLAACVFSRWLRFAGLRGGLQAVGMALFIVLGPRHSSIYIHLFMGWRDQGKFVSTVECAWIDDLANLGILFYLMRLGGYSRAWRIVLGWGIYYFLSHFSLCIIMHAALALLVHYGAYSPPGDIYFTYFAFIVYYCIEAYFTSDDCIFIIFVTTWAVHQY